MMKQNSLQIKGTTHLLTSAKEVYHSLEGFIRLHFLNDITDKMLSFVVCFLLPWT